MQILFRLFLSNLFAHLRIISYLLLTGLVGLMSGCGMLHTLKQSQASEAGTKDPSLRTRPYLPRIDLIGRLSIFYRQDNKLQAVHGNFQWRQNDAVTQVTLLSPFGATIAVLEWDAQQARLMQPKRALVVANNIDALAFQTLGWPLPFSGLSDWLQGFVKTSSAPAMTVVTPATPQPLTSENGWRLQYVSWQVAPVGTADFLPNKLSNKIPEQFPKRIDLTRATGPASPIVIRIVIDTWQPR